VFCLLKLLKRRYQVAEYIVILRDNCSFASFSSHVDNNDDGHDDDDENHNAKNRTNDHRNI